MNDSAVIGNTEYAETVTDFGGSVEVMEAEHSGFPISAQQQELTPSAVASALNENRPAGLPAYEVQQTPDLELADLDDSTESGNPAPRSSTSIVRMNDDAGPCKSCGGPPAETADGLCSQCALEENEAKEIQRQTESELTDDETPEENAVNRGRVSDGMDKDVALAAGENDLGRDDHDWAGVPSEPSAMAGEFSADHTPERAGMRMDIYHQEGKGTQAGSGTGVLPGGNSGRGVMSTITEAGSETIIGVQATKADADAWPDAPTIKDSALASANGQTYTSEETVTISHDDFDIIYRINSGAIQYHTSNTIDIEVSAETYIEAWVFNGVGFSDVTEATVYIQCATPVPSVAAGTKYNKVSITFPTTYSESIRYTVDGTTPTSTTGTVYSGSFDIDGGPGGGDAGANQRTLKAIAYKTDCIDSAVSSDLYTFVASLDIPAITWGSSPNGFNGGDAEVECTPATSGATLKWEATNPTETGSHTFVGLTPYTITAFPYQAGGYDSPWNLWMEKSGYADSTIREIPLTEP